MPISDVGPRMMDVVGGRSCGVWGELRSRSFARVPTTGFARLLLRSWRHRNESLTPYQHLVDGANRYEANRPQDEPKQSQEESNNSGVAWDAQPSIPQLRIYTS